MTTSSLPKALNLTAWVAQLLAAGIFVMTSLAKLTASTDAVALFTTLGVEPWGRVALGILELLTGLLLVWPRTAPLGGLIALGIMMGAIATHLLKIGVLYNGDPSLFIMALVEFAAAAVVVYLRRGQLALRDHQ